VARPPSKQMQASRCENGICVPRETQTPHGLRGQDTVRINQAGLRVKSLGWFGTRTLHNPPPTPRIQNCQCLSQQRACLCTLRSNQRVLARAGADRPTFLLPPARARSSAPSQRWNSSSADSVVCVTDRQYRRTGSGPPDDSTIHRQAGPAARHADSGAAPTHGDSVPGKTSATALWPGGTSRLTVPAVLLQYAVRFLGRIHLHGRPAARNIPHCCSVSAEHSLRGLTPGNRRACPLVVCRSGTSRNPTSARVPSAPCARAGMIE